MIFPEYERFDALGLAELIRKGEVSAKEVLEAALERMAARNPEINAVISELPAHARRRVREGLPEGPLRGVPFLLKDILAWEGQPMTLGCNLLRDNLATETAPVLDRFLRAGLVVFGRTSTSEMGLLPTTEAVVYGPTKNPWALQHSAGGSSGGAAAAVAARILPAAHGNDGGGSLRIPAAACGLFGLKPSRGRNPASPMEPPDGHVVEHAITRTVRDSAALLDVTRGALPGDRFWCPPPERDFLAAATEDPRPLKIAFATADFFGRPAHPDCRAAVLDAAALCESLGHQVVEARPEVDGEAYSDAFQVVWCAGAGLILRMAVHEAGKAGVPSVVTRLLDKRPILETLLRVATLRTGKAPFEPFTRRLARLERSMGPASVWLAWQAFERAHRTLAAFFEDFDLTLTPTLGEPPWPLGHFDQSASLDALREMLLRYVAYTPFANTAGLPAMSVPLHWNDAGLPIGVHFMGRFAEEALLFSLAGQLERARPWAERVPPMVASPAAAASNSTA